jgi:signal transduction histidine kinase
LAFAPSVSRSLEIMAVLVFTVIVGVTFQQLAELRAATLTQTFRQVARLNMVMAEQTGRAIETVDLILRDVVEQQRGLQEETAANPTAVRDSLRRRINGVRQLLAVEVADAQGHIVTSTRAQPADSLPPDGQSLLLRHAADPNLGIQFSAPLRQGDGSWTTLVTQRIDGPNRQFDGLAIGLLNLAYFEDFYKAVDLSENGAILLHRRDGVVLARFPHSEQAYGQSHANLAPFRDVLSHTNAGTLEIENPLDRTLRLLSIRALRAFPLAVAVSVDEAAVLAGWRHQTLIFAFASIGCALTVSGLMFLLAHRSRQMQVLLGQSVQAGHDAKAANTGLMVQMEERERAEAALRQSQRVEAVGQLTGGVAHDFNNLLTILLGNIELMQSHPAASAFTQRLTTMRAAAERGALLTNHVLAFARRQPLMPRSVDLGCLIHGMAPLLASALGPRISLVLNLDNPGPTVHVDAAQIELIVLNIAINARDAMPQGGTLRITARLDVLPQSNVPDAPQAGRYLCLRISDTGIGMSPEVLAHAFDPYFTTKPAGTGSGLGLSQVYGIALQSGGQARIESVPGSGTTVEIHLPCSTAAAPAPQDKPAEASPPPAPANRATVLVVDDDHAVRSTTAMLLRRSGYTVTEADGGDTALAILAHDGSIELLLSDVVMPTMTGTELARQVTAMRPDLPILFVSGYADPQAIAGSIPASRLVKKPFRPAELIRLIERTLAETRNA